MRKTFLKLLGATALGAVFATTGLATQGFAPAYAKDSLVLGVSLEPPHLDPTAGAAAAIDEVVYANVFEGLTRINQNGEVKPALAKSWDISDDGLNYTFHLNEGVKFHDGTTMDAEDVKFSLDRARAEDSTNAQKPLFADISSVEVIDPQTVKVVLSKPNGSFLFNMGWGDAVIVAPETADKNKSNPVGTGPFKFSKWAKGSSVTLENNPDYWGEKAALSKATFRIVPDPAAALSSLLAGDVDAFPQFPSYETVPTLQGDDRFTVKVGSTEGETILSTNNARPPFDNIKVRRAIAHAIDRKALIDGALFGLGTPIGTHFAPHHPAYKDLTARYPYDIEKSKALLAEAGFPDGIKATLKLPPPVYARRGGEILAAGLRKAGIELEIINVEWAQWIDQVFKKKDYDLTIISHTEPQDINIYGRDGYYFNYTSQAFKDLMTKLNNETDAEKRNAILGDAQMLITEDAVNGFLFQLPKTGVWKKELEGFWENSPVQANDLTKVHWVK